MVIFLPPFFGVSLLNREEVVINRLQRSECPTQILETTRENIVAISTCTRFYDVIHLVLLVEVRDAPHGSVLHTEVFSSMVASSNTPTAECVLHSFVWRIPSTHEVLEGEITFDIVPPGLTLHYDRFQVSTYVVLTEAVYRIYPCGRRLAPANFYCHIKQHRSS